MNVRLIIFRIGVFLIICSGCSHSGKTKLNQEFFERIDIPIGVRTNSLLPVFLNNDEHLDLLVIGEDRLYSLYGSGRQPFIHTF